jgi:hypothetical protein
MPPYPGPAYAAPASVTALYRRPETTPPLQGVPLGPGPAYAAPVSIITAGVQNQLLLFKECLPAQAQLTQLLRQLQHFTGVQKQLLLFKECLLALPSPCLYSSCINYNSSQESCFDIKSKMSWIIL